ncbi:hypothetical protein JCM17961_00510 [Endothiovibrio diazotrophicus]
MVGLLSIDYVRDSWVQPLAGLARAGFVDAAPLLAARNDAYLEEYLLARLREGDCHYLFFYSDSLHGHFRDAFFETVRAAGVRVIAFHADDEPEAWFAANAPYDHRFDVVASHSRRGTGRRAEGIGERALYLPWGYNPARFHLSAGALEKRWDVVFIGTNNVYGMESSGGDGRQRVLEALYRHCRLRSYSFALFGAGWERHPRLAECAGGALDHESMLDVYHRARIVFNPGLSADNAEGGYQTKLRHFEVAGCGAFQLVNDNPELRELFVADEEMVFYRDRDELFERVDFYLKNDEARERIAAAAQCRAIAEHTTAGRLRRLFGHADRLCGATGEVWGGAGSATVRTLRLSEEAAVELLSRCEMGEAFPGDEPYLHLAVGRFGVVSLDYSLLAPLLVDGASMLFAARCFIEFGVIHENAMQRKPQNIVGELLPERFHPRAVSERVERFVAERLACLADGEWCVPLVSLVVRRDGALPLLRAWVDGDGGFLSRHPVHETGVVVADLRLEERPRFLGEAPYITAWRRLAAQLAARGARVVIYAARGEMAERARAVAAETGLEVLGWVDRRLAGEEVDGLPVYDASALPALCPDAVVIAAAHSGKAIHEAIGGLAARMALIPLHDLGHPVWGVMSS